MEYNKSSYAPFNDPLEFMEMFLWLFLQAFYV